MLEAQTNIDPFAQLDSVAEAGNRIITESLSKVLGEVGGIETMYFDDKVGAIPPDPGPITEPKPSPGPDKPPEPEPEPEGFTPVI